MLSADVPIYKLNLGVAYPELKGIALQTTGRSERPVAGLALALAYALTGNWFPGTDGNITVPEFFAEIQKGAEVLRLPINRLTGWAKSINQPATATLPASDYGAMPKRVWDARDGWMTPHPYQMESAAWAAMRMGCCLALGCGVGKTISAVVAGRTAADSGRISRETCVIVCPCNAEAVWMRYKDELAKSFKHVVIKSTDTTHHLNSLDRQAGGLLIVDEGHNMKNTDSLRTGRAFELRQNFDMCLVLTGTFANTGMDGVMMMQDLAVPGLSRSIIDLDLGEYFGAVKFEQVRHQSRRKLTFVPDDRMPDFVRYLERSTRSLSTVSPEVAAVIHIPGQRFIDIESFDTPMWRLDLVKSLQAEAKAKLPKGAEWDEAAWWKTAPIAVADRIEWDYYLGATAVAIMEEQRDMLVEYAIAEGLISEDPATVDELQKVHEAVVERYKKACEDPFMLDKDKKALKEKTKWFGLPDFPRILATALREGRVDRIAVLKERRGLMSWVWEYAPGSDRKNPRPGPKIEWVRRWIHENPKEPLVLGAQGTTTVNMLAQMLTDEGKAFEIIRGGVDGEDRGVFETQFQTGKINYIVLQEKAGSECITLTRSAHSLLVDRDHSSLTYTQYLARTCRQTQKRECNHYDLVDNPLQAQQLRNLRRGRDFDAETRRKLEETVQYDRFIPLKA